MSDEEKKGTSFKVNDRRMFDNAGNERGAEKSVKPEVRGEDFTARPPEKPHGDIEVTFTSFVMSLATQALMQLGQLPPPEGVQIPPDREAASHTIDILGMIETKTKGNLDKDEARLLQDALHSVRMCFVNSK